MAQPPRGPLSPPGDLMRREPFIERNWRHSRSRQTQPSGSAPAATCRVVQGARHVGDVLLEFELGRVHTDHHRSP